MDKEQQKKLITEVMQADEKDGLYKQQTAIGYLISNLPERFKNGIMNMYAEELEQAKEIEKEHIRMAYLRGRLNAEEEFKTSEQYYNDTYGEDKTFKRKSEWTKVNK